MKVKLFILVCMALFITVTAQTVLAAGAVKVAVSSQTLGTGEDLGAVLLLGGDGNYDVYAAITGGLLQEALYMFTPTGILPATAEELPKLRENVDLAGLSVNDKIIQLLPKFSVDAAALAGVYSFYVALCTPGQLDFVALDMVQVEIKQEE